MRRQTKTAKVKTATCLNGDKLKRQNPKRRQEMVVLCEAFKQSFRALTVSVSNCIISVSDEE